MKQEALIITLALVVCGAWYNDPTEGNDVVLCPGQMPNLTKDLSGRIHLVYGSGDSILYSYSSDKGQTFSKPSLVAVLPKLVAFATRGPQIAATSSGLSVTACDGSGNIFSYFADQSGNWRQGTRVNDRDTLAKEALMALSADGQNAFAVWLDLRDGPNEIYGSKSVDGGKTWSKNMKVYASPDGTVCQCCKPSVKMKGNHVFVMFRNFIKESRDLYLIQSADGGKSFGKAQKLGQGTWTLEGCPMDGGGLAINQNGDPQTVWNRKGKIYACSPGKEEVVLGEGRNCSIEPVNNKNVYAWVSQGRVVVMDSRGMKRDLGSGQLPVLVAIDPKHVICIWENEKQIHKAILDI